MEMLLMITGVCIWGKATQSLAMYFIRLISVVRILLDLLGVSVMLLLVRYTRMMILLVL